MIRKTMLDSKIQNATSFVPPLSQPLSPSPSPSAPLPWTDDLPAMSSQEQIARYLKFVLQTIRDERFYFMNIRTKRPQLDLSSFHQLHSNNTRSQKRTCSALP